MMMAEKKSQKFGRNGTRCERYRAKHGGGTAQRKHFRKRSTLLTVTGVCDGLPLPGELSLTQGALTGNRRRSGRKARGFGKPPQPGLVTRHAPPSEAALNSMAAMMLQRTA